MLRVSTCSILCVSLSQTTHRICLVAIIKIQLHQILMQKHLRAGRHILDLFRQRSVSGRSHNHGSRHTAIGQEHDWPLTCLLECFVSARNELQIMICPVCSQKSQSQTCSGKDAWHQWAADRNSTKENKNARKELDDNQRCRQGIEASRWSFQLMDVQ
jgi:hypothetical protein